MTLRQFDTISQKGYKKTLIFLFSTTDPSTESKVHYFANYGSTLKLRDSDLSRSYVRTGRICHDAEELYPGDAFMHLRASSTGIYYLDDDGNSRYNLKTDLLGLNIVKLAPATEITEVVPATIPVKPKDVFIDAKNKPVFVTGVNFLCDTSVGTIEMLELLDPVKYKKAPDSLMQFSVSDLSEYLYLKNRQEQQKHMSDDQIYKLMIYHERIVHPENERAKELIKKGFYQKPFAGATSYSGVIR